MAEEIAEATVQERLDALALGRRAEQAERGFDVDAGEAAFARLAPPLQEGIWQAGWEQLQPAQVEAIGAILDEECDLLITTATASGKTEAALLPILTKLAPDPMGSVKCLYVSPLKALINDQRFRLEPLAAACHVPLHAWHGDISQSQRDRLVREPGGILQTTPESLESILGNRREFLRSLFGGLQFVVLDEVHSLAGTDRGVHLGCLLHRLNRYVAEPPRLVALSATVGDPETVRRYLRPDDPERVRVISGEVGRRRQVLYRHDHVSHPGSLLPDPAVDMVFQRTVGRSAIVFCATRRAAEDLAARLNGRARAQDSPTEYLAHHSSLSKSERERVEARMREIGQRAVIVSTSTLELGIDIGALDLVVQVNAAPTLAGFVQRMGRTGRQDGDPHVMYTLTTDGLADRVALRRTAVVDEIPWRLLHNAAVSDMALREGRTEAPRVPTAAVHVMFQQILQLLKERGSMDVVELGEELQATRRFPGVMGATVEVDGQRVNVASLMLRHMLEQNLVKRIPDSRSIRIGEAADRLAHGYEGLSVLQESVEWRVRDATRELGGVPATRVNLGDHFVLAGRPWTVTGVDEARRQVAVAPAGAAEALEWHGDGGPEVDPAVVERARQILLEGHAPLGRLGEAASNSLELARARARQYRMGERQWFPVMRRVRRAGGGDPWWRPDGGMWLPWRGSREVDSALSLLRAAHADEQRAANPAEAQGRRGWREADREERGFVDDSLAPWRVYLRMNHEAVMDLCRRASGFTAEQVARRLEDGSVVGVKFSEHLPRGVLEHRFTTDCYEHDAALELVHELRASVEAARVAELARGEVLPVLRRGAAEDIRRDLVPLLDVAPLVGGAAEVPRPEAGHDAEADVAEAVMEDGR